MAAVDFFSSFGYKWGQDGSVYNWDDAQYKQGWATIGSVPPSVEQFNRVHQVADEKANWLYQQIKSVTDNASLALSAAASDTLLKAIQKSSMLILPTTPGSQLSSTIYVEDREQILRWKTLGSFTGYVSPQVGSFTWGTTETPRPWEADLIGQTVDRADPKYTALYWWAQTTGRFIAAGSWTAGTYFFSEMGGTLFRLPDLRNMFVRATGTNLDTANARALGSNQDATAISMYGNGTNAADVYVPIRNADGSFSHSSVGGFAQKPASYVAKPTEMFYRTRPSNVALQPRLHL